MNPDSSDLHYIMEKILILDFGSQYTQLIARRVRELNVYCEIHPFNKIPVPDASVRGVILSGSPFSVRDEHAPAPDLSAIRVNCPCWVSATARSSSHRPSAVRCSLRPAASTAVRCLRWAMPVTR